jgi:hypothetical protein
MWFITYQHPLRREESGIKFVENEAATFAAGKELEASGYVITSVAPTSKARMEAFLAGTLSDPEQPLVG